MAVAKEEHEIMYYQKGGHLWKAEKRRNRHLHFPHNWQIYSNICTLVQILPMLNAL
jgi:hypothetical protein